MDITVVSRASTHSQVSAHVQVNVAASIQMYDILIPGKRPCGPKLLVMGAYPGHYGNITILWPFRRHCREHRNWWISPEQLVSIMNLAKMASICLTGIDTHEYHKQCVFVSRYRKAYQPWPLQATYFLVMHTVMSSTNAYILLLYGSHPCADWQCTRGVHVLYMYFSQCLLFL